MIPSSNKYSVVGICMRENMESTNRTEDVSMSLASGCTSCEIENLFLHFEFRDTKYATNFGIHMVMHLIWQKNWRVFWANYDSRVLVTRDLNINHIKFTDDKANLSYLTTFPSWKHHSLQTWLTSHSATFTMFLLKFSNREWFPNTTNGTFYCNIWDPLSCFISIQHENRFNLSNRPMTRVFSEKNCANFRIKMDYENWAQIYHDESGHFYTNLITILPPIMILASIWSENVGMINCG